MSKNLFEDIGSQLSEQNDTTSGQMFGKPCLKTNNKAFAAFFKESMVFKIGREEIIHLANQYPNTVQWDPSGKNRPMKDWLQVPIEYENDWMKLAKQAFHFVNNQVA